MELFTDDYSNTLPMGHHLMHYHLHEIEILGKGEGQMAERLGNRAINQKVVGSIPRWEK